MGHVSIKTFSKNLKKYIEKAKKGEDITIYDENKLFRLKQIKQKGKEFRPYGMCKGEFTISDDFNEQLPNEWLNEFYK